MSTAADRVYRETKEQILSGEVPPGRLLSEVDTAARMAVSRTPVREAFVRLQAEELLELIPKRGAVVVPVPMTEAADVLETRAALETAAARRICARQPIGDQPADSLTGQLTGGQPGGGRLGDPLRGGQTGGRLGDPLAGLLGTLAELIRRQRDAAARGAIAEFAELDAELHTAVVNASGNRLAQRFYATLADRQRRMNVWAITPDPNRMLVFAVEHEQLAGHLAARDVAGFETTLRAHFTAVHGAAAQWLA